MMKRLSFVLVFVAMAVSSLTSGIVITRTGWGALNQLALPFLGVVTLAIALLWIKKRH